jgi:integrase
MKQESPEQKDRGSRQQVGYLFHRGRSWFLRFADDKLEADGTIRRKLMCRKLDVPYGDEYRSKASVKAFAAEILAPINARILTPKSTLLVADFIRDVFLPHAEKKVRQSTIRGYKYIWKVHLKNRFERPVFHQTLRQFRTCHGEELLAAIARDTGLSRNSLKRIKSFLSGAFETAKRLGYLDAINPIHGVSIPRSKEPEETYAYSLDEIKKMLAVLDEPSRTIVLTAALTGLRKGEIRGLRWEDFNEVQLNVNRSMWNSVENPPKTARSKAAVPIVKELGDALEDHREKMGRLAVGFIFQAGNGKPLNLDNLVRRVIVPAIEKCVRCHQSQADHETDGHAFQLDKSLQWQGWHSFRRGLATNLHALGVADKTIQQILRHSNIAMTQNVYIKSLAASGVSAMDLLGAEMKKEAPCNNLATNRTALPN